MFDETEYSVLMRPLKEDDGGGWVAIVPDLPGCQSDGLNGAEAYCMGNCRATFRIARV